jgi:hypothetical protein
VLDHNPSLYHYIQYFLDNIIDMTDIIHTDVEIPARQHRICFVEVTVKDFVGQLHGLDLPNMPWVINVDEVGEFVEELWAKIVTHLSRGVNFTSNSTGEIGCSWMDDHPSIDDIYLYATIANSVGHRPVEWSRNMEISRLRSLANKNLKLNIFKFSTHVNCKGYFTKVQKVLLNPAETDRAGAASINIHNAMKIKLRELHGEHYNSSDINWGIWATYILQKPADRHEDLVSFGPPVELISLFSPTSVPAQVTLSNLHHTNQVGLDMVEALLLEMPRIRSTIQELSTRFEAHERILRIYERQFSITTRITSDIVETRASRDIFSQIVNEEDVEHMIVDENM